MIADNLINPQAEAYADNFTSPEGTILKNINKETTEHHQQAHMLSGHVQGKLLSFISIILQPKYVLEIGTFTGYSALCLAEGLQKDGELHTIELREEDADIALKNFNQQKSIISLHCTAAKQWIYYQHCPICGIWYLLTPIKRATLNTMKKLCPAYQTKGSS